MKKLILLFLTVSLLSCSAENNETEEDRGTFRVPSMYWGNYENEDSGHYIKVEEYRIEFDMPDGEVIVITRGSNMAQIETYPVTFDGKIVELDMRTSSIYLWYFDWDNTVMYFEHGYARVY